MLGGVYRSPGEFPGYIYGAACTGGACRYGTSGEGDLDGFFFDAEYQPVMERGGIRLGQAFYDATSNPDAPQELTGYGAWLHYNTFLVQISFHPDKGAPDSVQAAPYSVGRASGTNPVSGSASWTGVAVGHGPEPAVPRSRHAGRGMPGSSTTSAPPRSMSRSTISSI